MKKDERILCYLCKKEMINRTKLGMSYAVYYCPKCNATKVRNI